MDTKKLTSEVAARHGLLVRDDGPAMALVTMSEIVLQQVLERAEARLRALLSDAETGQKMLQQEALVWVQDEIGHAYTNLAAHSEKFLLQDCYMYIVT